MKQMAPKVTTAKRKTPKQAAIAYRALERKILAENEKKWRKTLKDEKQPLPPRQTAPGTDSETKPRTIPYGCDCPWPKETNSFTIVAVTAVICLIPILLFLFSPLPHMLANAMTGSGSFVSAQASSVSHLFDPTPAGEIEKYLKEHANDPSSIQIVSVSEPSKPWSDGTRLVRCSFRGKNAFGALILTTWTFRLNPDNSVAIANDLTIW